MSLFATAVSDVNSLQREISKRQDQAFECHKAGATRDERFYALLCNDSTTNSNDKAEALLRRPIIAELVIEMSNWIGVISQISDVYRGNNKIYETLDELIESPVTVKRGRELIAKSITVLDIAVSSYAQTYGGVPALGIIDLLDAAVSAPADGTGDPQRQAAAGAIDVLNGQNSYLAANVTMILLKREYQRKWLAGGIADILPENIYTDCFAAVEQKKPEGIFMMRALFGNQLNFGLTEDGLPALVIEANGTTAALRLPAPSEYSLARVIYPPRYYRLLSEREEMVNKLADYDLISESDSSAGDRAALLMGN